MRTAWIFPGQGSQYPGMGRELSVAWAPSRRFWDVAESLSGLAVRELSWHGPASELRRPRVLEPALLAVSLAHADRLQAHGARPQLVAGYSAGELAALCTAGVLDVEAAFEIAVLRGQILEEAAGAVPSRMVAISDLPAFVSHALVAASAAPDDIAVAGWNAPDHVTISGRESLVREVERRAIQLGSEVAEVDIAGPWHCELARGASQRIAAALRHVRFQAPHVTFFASAIGDPVWDPNEIRELFAAQIRKPVLWYRTVTQLLLHGAADFLEVGPGRFATVLLRRVLASSARSIRAVERRGGALARVASPRSRPEQPNLAHTGEIA